MVNINLKIGVMVIVLVQCFVLISAEDKTLVLLDNFVTKETHSKFFELLKNDGHLLTFKLADDQKLSLKEYGEPIYDNLILFSPNVDEFGGYMSKDAVLEFIDEGGNMLLVTGSEPSSLLREIGSECGVEVDAPGNILIDHFNYDLSDAGNHTLIAVDAKNLFDAPLITGSRDIAPILYEGGGLLVKNTNPLVLPLLTAYSTSYCSNEGQQINKDPNLLGKDVTLIAGVQARNNARAVFSGSLYLFSDKAIKVGVQTVKNEKFGRSGNYQLIQSLTKWVFKKSGVIRVKSTAHHKLGENNAPDAYTIMDMAVFKMELELKKGNQWVPFNADDIQLEFVRIDPFIRTIIPRVADGKYEVTFKVPDIYGVFKFNVDYKRIGYTNIFSNTQVSVRPLQHTQYERFITSAYPYYVSAFSMMFGVVLLSIVFLHVDTKEKIKGE